MPELDEALGALDRELGDHGVVGGGRSNVEAITSPLTRRSKSVTSSGRSSTSTTMRWHSGLFEVIEFAMDLQQRGLARRGRGDDEPALSLADRRGQVDDPADEVAGFGLEAQPLARVERRHRGELDPVLDRVGVDAVDAVDPHHRVELLLALPFAGLTHQPDDGVTAAQTYFRTIDSER